MAVKEDVWPEHIVVELTVTIGKGFTKTVVTVDPKQAPLFPTTVKEEKGKGIYVSDATEVYVTNPEEMFEVMRAGSKNRSIAATRMNEKSSRSHSIFLLTIYQKNT